MTSQIVEAVAVVVAEAVAHVAMACVPQTVEMNVEATQYGHPLRARGTVKELVFHHARTSAIILQSINHCYNDQLGSNISYYPIDLIGSTSL